MNIDVECWVDYRVSDDDAHIPKKTLSVKSHWNYRCQVWIVIGETTVLVDGDEIIQAIKNCQNSK